MKNGADEPFLVRLQSVEHWRGIQMVLTVEQFDLRPGSLCALVGHNGAGKTTLLRLIAGLDKPSRGNILRKLEMRGVILCFQAPYMFYGTVRQNLRYGLRFERNIAKSSADEIGERMGLAKLFERRAKTLSAGETQRVALARALVCRPRLLLLDEPTANLDSDSVAIIEQEIRRFHHDGGTVVLATHSSETVYRLGATVYRLERGRLSIPELSNVFSGNLILDDNGAAFVVLSSGIRFRCLRGRVGGCSVAIPAQELVVSTSKPEADMCNQFKGTVKEMRQGDRSVKLQIDIGVELSALVTQDAFREMHVHLGDSVFVSFRDHAVKTL